MYIFKGKADKWKTIFIKGECSAGNVPCSYVKLIIGNPSTGIFPYEPVNGPSNAPNHFILLLCQPICVHYGSTLKDICKVGISWKEKLERENENKRDWKKLITDQDG